jgi:hypothetical protein
MASLNSKEATRKKANVELDVAWVEKGKNMARRKSAKDQQLQHHQ